jgi:hypothetical protein
LERLKGASHQALLGMLPPLFHLTDFSDFCVGFFFRFYFLAPPSFPLVPFNEGWPRVDVLGVRIVLVSPLRAPERLMPATDVWHGLFPSTASLATSGLGLASCQCPWHQDRTGGTIATTRVPDACERHVAWPPPLYRFPHCFWTRTWT